MRLTYNFVCALFSVILLIHHLKEKLAFDRPEMGEVFFDEAFPRDY